MITIELGYTLGRITGTMPKNVREELRDEMSYEINGFQFMSIGNSWDGRYKLLKRDGEFPIGLYKIAENTFRKYGVKYTIVDNREDPAGKPLPMREGTYFIPRDYQVAAKDAAIKAGGGIIQAATGCHALGQKVIMFDGSLRAVEDVLVGDTLMGPDSTSRTVLELCRGRDQMIKVIPTKGNSFIINKGHILSLQKTGSDEIIDIKFSEYEDRNKTFKARHKLFRAGVSFDEKDLIIEPYLAGLVFGDRYMLDICTEDVVEYFYSAQKIPEDYKTSSHSQRMKFLAGMIDSKGTPNYNGYVLDFKNKMLAEDVAFIARSLGFAAYINESRYYRLSISGDCYLIPSNLHSVPNRVQNKSVLKVGFTYEELGEDDYYGFRLDGDHRYLLDDFTVTHNSGKTLLISMILGHYNCKTVIYVIGTDLLYQMKNTIEEAYGIEVGVVGDGHCDIKQVTVATVWSAAAAFNQKVKYIDSNSKVDNARKNKKLDKARVRKMVNDAELIVIDECQFSASATISFLSRQSKAARYRFSLSGTPWRDTGDDILIEAVGGPKFFKIDATSLIEKGWLVRPTIHFVPVSKKFYPDTKYPQVYNQYIVDNPERNKKIIDAAKKLIEKKRKILILVLKRNHGKNLLKMLEEEGIRASSLDGNNKTKDRLKAIADMKEGNIDVLVASKIFDQGVDIPELDALILAGSGKSTGRALQRIGRVIRTGPEDKTSAVVVDFYDDCKYLKKHSKSRYNIYKTEPGFRIRLPKGKKL